MGFGVCFGFVAVRTLTDVLDCDVVMDCVYCGEGLSEFPTRDELDELQVMTISAIMLIGDVCLCGNVTIVCWPYPLPPHLCYVLLSLEKTGRHFSGPF